MAAPQRVFYAPTDVDTDERPDEARQISLAVHRINASKRFVPPPPRAQLRQRQMIAALSRPAPLNGASNTVKAVDEEVHVNDENELLSDDDQFKQLQTPLTPPELVKFEKFKEEIMRLNGFVNSSAHQVADFRIIVQSAVRHGHYVVENLIAEMQRSGAELDDVDELTQDARNKVLKEGRQVFARRFGINDTHLLTRESFSKLNKIDRLAFLELFQVDHKTVREVSVAAAMGALLNGTRRARDKQQADNNAVLQRAEETKMKKKKKSNDVEVKKSVSRNVDPKTILSTAELLISIAVQNITESLTASGDVSLATQAVQTALLEQLEALKETDAALLGAAESCAVSVADAVLSAGLSVISSPASTPELMKQAIGGTRAQIDVAWRAAGEQTNTFFNQIADCVQATEEEMKGKTEKEQSPDNALKLLTSKIDQVISTLPSLSQTSTFAAAVCAPLLAFIRHLTSTLQKSIDESDKYSLSQLFTDGVELVELARPCLLPCNAVGAAVAVKIEADHVMAVWLRLQKISAERAPSLRTFLANAGGRELRIENHPLTDSDALVFAISIIDRQNLALAASLHNYKRADGQDCDEQRDNLRAIVDAVARVQALASRPPTYVYTRQTLVDVVNFNSILQTLALCQHGLIRRAKTRQSDTNYQLFNADLIEFASGGSEVPGHSPDYDEYQQIVGFTPAEFAYQPPPFNVVWNYAQIRSTQELLHANRLSKEEQVAAKDEERAMHERFLESDLDLAEAHYPMHLYEDLLDKRGRLSEQDWKRSETLLKNVFGADQWKAVKRYYNEHPCELVIAAFESIENISDSIAKKRKAVVRTAQKLLDLDKRAELGLRDAAFVLADTINSSIKFTCNVNDICYSLAWYIERLKKNDERGKLMKTMSKLVQQLAEEQDTSFRLARHIFSLDQRFNNIPHERAMQLANILLGKDVLKRWKTELMQEASASETTKATIAPGGEAVRVVGSQVLRKIAQPSCGLARTIIGAELAPRTLKADQEIVDAARQIMRLVAQSKQVDSSPLSVAAQDLARVAEATYNNTAESSPNAIQSPRYQPTSTQVGYEAPVAKVLVLHGDHDKRHKYLAAEFQRLVITGCGLSDVGVAYIADLLKVNNAIQLLQFESANSHLQKHFHQRSPPMVAQRTEKEDKIYRFRLDEFLSNSYSLRELHLFNNAIGDGGCALLAEALRYNRSVRTIYLSRNRIGSEGAMSLAFALSPPQLPSPPETLKSNSPEYHRFVTAQRKRAFGSYPVVSFLDLRSNEIGNEGLEQLFKMLRVNDLLSTLYLADNAPIGLNSSQIDFVHETLQMRPELAYIGPGGAESSPQEDDPISTVGNDADDDEKKKKGCIIA